MAEVTIGLGIILSLVLSETLGVTAVELLCQAILPCICINLFSCCYIISSYYCLGNYSNVREKSVSLWET